MSHPAHVQRPTDSWKPPRGLRFNLSQDVEPSVVLTIAQSFGRRALASGIGYMLALIALILTTPQLFELSLFPWVCGTFIAGSQLLRLWVSRLLSQTQLAGVARLYGSFAALTYLGAVGWGALLVYGFAMMGPTIAPMITLLIVCTIAAGSLGTISQSSLVQTGFLILMVGPIFFYSVWHALRTDERIWATVSLIVSVVFLFVIVQGRRMRQEFTEGVESQIRLIETTQKLREANALTAQEARAKEDFLATMSHEIRTPMNGVLGIAQLLQLSELTPHQRQLLDVMHASGQTLLAIINDILDLSKLQAGKMEVERVPVDPRKLVASMIDLMAPQAYEQGLELTFEVTQQVPAWIEADPTRLRQVLLNLLSNAIKFTDAGWVHVHVQVNTAGLHVTVTDSGIGIEPHAHEEIFDAFSQAGSATSRKYGGTGLGLSICRQLVTAMQGTITVRSEPGAGAAFDIVLPLPAQLVAWHARTVPVPMQLAIWEPHVQHRRMLAREIELLGIDGTRATSDADASGARLLTRFPGDAESAQQWLQRLPPDSVVMATPQDALHLSKHVAGRCTILTVPVHAEKLRPALVAEPAPGADVSPPSDPEPSKHVLVVDDCPTNRLVAEALLQSLGYATTTACDGDEALQKLDETSFDLVLMDCEMPGTDGYTATRRLRERELAENRARTPVIAATAHVLESQRDKCLSAGMDATLSKPLDLKLMQQLIGKHTRAAKQTYST